MGKCTRKILEKDSTDIEGKLFNLKETYKEIVQELNKNRLINKTIKNKLLAVNLGVAIYHERQGEYYQPYIYYAHSKVKDSTHELFSFTPIQGFEVFEAKQQEEREKLIEKAKKTLLENFVFEENTNFKYHEVDKNRNINCEGCRPTRKDAEAKILEKLSNSLTNGVMQNGRLYMYTYLEPCVNCDYVIMQFMDRHQNIDINIYFEEPYNSIDFGGDKS